MAAYIRSSIEAGPSRREAVELLEEEWPEEAFSKTAIKTDKDVPRREKLVGSDGAGDDSVGTIPERR